MPQAQSFLQKYSGDRIQWMAVLIVLCFVSVFLLESQSAASYPTYILALVMIATIRHWMDVFKLPMMRLTVALLIWLCLSAFWSEPFEWREVLTVWSRGLLVFCFLVAVAECQLRGQMQRWMGKALAVVGGVAMAGALVNFTLTDPADGRLNGLGQLDTHVIAALVFGVVLVFTLKLLHEEQHFMWKLFAAASILLAVVCIGLSDSRTAWVSTILGGGTYLLATKIKDPRQLLVAVVSMVFVGGVLFLALVLNDTTRELLLPRGDSFRLSIWSHTLERIVQSPWVGLGINTLDEIRTDDVVHAHPHSLYLALWYQGGVVALGMYLVVLVLSLRSVLLRYETRDAKLALSVLVLGSSAFLLDGHELLDKIGEAWFLVWLPVGISLGLRWGGSVPR